MPFIDANGVSLHYELAGSTGAPSCCCTSSAARCNSWDAVAPRLAAALSRAALRPARLRAFGKGAAGIHQRRAGRGFRSAGQGRRARSALPFRHRRRRRDPGACAFWKSIRTRSARWCCAIRRRASIRAAPRRSTSAPRLPCARACAPRCRRRCDISYPPKARRARRLRGLSRPLSGQRSGRLRLWLPRAGAHQHAAHAAADPLPGHGGRRPPRHGAAACRHAPSLRRRFPARASS